ncbi:MULTISPECIES: rhodanese-like domain-containing protein [Acinetobacter]|jgi:rhodanese-related sulfurtransferase|uniref:rhodanese-like domain-containing protein n=1 Tax=Acinetobacter TaxID=469 RepID=UPI0015BF670C|nr:MULTISPECIES: rhodanese-like domain-containing protein [Acinetobacter]MCO8047886.1 rhodanese-like domain-containing protein [Acinetobacter towneri]MCO8055829.1 rhodanese-like domain-containing protein [Acinetobacter towneri]MDD4852484.1 rhodanese-like domain-containing protein [Acinetobacter towneri]MDM1282479.1 rhodanese-like domain-containing protein [Acinetobacter towneri]MDM1736285.1 rhodanese-like domain-containing protein [Acinetobacter towneri]
MFNLMMYLPWGKVPEINAQDLLQQQQDVQIVDVRTRKEFCDSHIQGALHLPLSQMNESNVKALSLAPTKPVVTICLSAHRSIPATRRLAKMGYQASQLQGGMKAWWKQQMPCVSSQVK